MKFFKLSFYIFGAILIISLLGISFFLNLDYIFLPIHLSDELHESLPNATIESSNYLEKHRIFSKNDTIGTTYFKCRNKEIPFTLSHEIVTISEYDGNFQNEIIKSDYFYNLFLYFKSDIYSIADEKGISLYNKDNLRELDILTDKSLSSENRRDLLGKEYIYYDLSSNELNLYILVQEYDNINNVFEFFKGVEGYIKDYFPSTVNSICDNHIRFIFIHPSDLQSNILMSNEFYSTYLPFTKNLDLYSLNENVLSIKRNLSTGSSSHP